ncbi:PREDICTED: protein PFC0760c-like [Polistes dominula]|uniref:Protein PFC0760c-like n=1 Tax=Polistes dominula TaxID=743375 RepID=A0ABM1I834_POLDO|nr:PREDICTED: protein PFC0760c-like [Polistes dominula]
MATSTERKKDPYQLGFVLAPRVPQGLAAVVESLTREVLRKRPEDIYVFAARHFEKLLTLREQYDDVDEKSNKKVLERHRNIFGDGDKKISTDEIRQLEKQDENLRSYSIGTKSKRGKMKINSDQSDRQDDTLKKQIKNDKESTLTKLDRNSKTMKIISQMPNVLITRNTDKKDIKMELRKNRLRDKSTDSSNEGQFHERNLDNSRINSSSSSSCKATEQRRRRRSRNNNELNDELMKKNKKIGRSESVDRYPSGTSKSSIKNELSKVRNMNEVQEYLTRNFNTTPNEIDTSYVDLVQNVIDQNVPIIKDKIDELKCHVLTNKSKNTRINNDTLLKRDIRPNTSEYHTKSYECDKYRSKRSSSVDSMMNFKRQQDDDTLENRLIDTQNILQGISSKCYNKSSSNILDENSKIILPAVRPVSSKNSKCLSRSDSNHLILPPISPDTVSEDKENNYSVDNKNDDDDDSNLGNDILQLSTSIKEDITSTRKMLENVNEVLKKPVNDCPIDDNKMIDEEMSSTNNTKENNETNDIVDNINNDNNFNDVLGEQIEVEVEVDVHAEDEIFQDSLNVTPDIIDIPPSPDSLEPIIDNPDLSMINDETKLKETFVEIEEIESNNKVENEHNEEMKSSEPVIVEVADDLISIETEEPVKEEIVEIIKLTANSDQKSESEFDDKSTGQLENDKSKDEINHLKEIDEIVIDDEEINNEQDNLLSIKDKKLKGCTLNVSSSKEVPFSYILTEGSPVEIPDFVTTVIIPERPPSSPESNLDIEEEQEEEQQQQEQEETSLREERRKRAVESFGEYIKPEQIECSTVDIDFIRGIKAGHEIAIIRQDLDGIKEEEESSEEDKKQLKSMNNEDQQNNEDTNKEPNSSLLEHISETEENDTDDDNDKCQKNKIIPIMEIEIETKNNIKEESNDNVNNLIENSLENEESTETIEVTSESTNEVKETTITDRSTDSLSLDPARPIVPELNLDSLRDITISSFKMNDADETVSLTEQTLSGKDKVDLDENDENGDDENDENDDDENLNENDQKEDNITPIEMISIDEKPMEINESLINLNDDELNKEKSSIISEEGEIIKNENELSQVSNKIQSTLTDTIEQCDTINKNDCSPIEYLQKIEEKTDLDTEEEIAKELIEIDRAENLSHLQDNSIISNDLPDENKSNEILIIVSEENIKSTNDKQDDNDSLFKNTISDRSIENLKETISPKDEEENISEKMDSTRSDDNLENNVKCETSLTAFEEVESNEIDTKLIDDEKKEYHIDVTDLKPIESQEKEDEDGEDESSKSSSSTFHSAATKIQAGIRGFLTRKKLQENNPHSSTLDSIPSIQESVAEEPVIDDSQLVSKEVADTLIKSDLSSAIKSENITKIDENEQEKPEQLTETISMTIKHRQQCLRREDAIQRNTLSTENAFASCGVQHTGEFHDCLPLPVLESNEMTRNNVLSENKDDDEPTKLTEEKLIDQNQTDECKKEDNALVESSNDLTLKSNERDDDDDDNNIENINRTSSSLENNLNNLFAGLNPNDLTKLLVNQVNRQPIMLGLVDIVSNSVIGTNTNVIFQTNDNLNVNDNLTGSVKDDSILKNSYLNFITSIEDNESNHVIKETSKEYMQDHSNEHSMQSLREPLALPGTPEGILIEELSSLDSTTMSKLQDVSFNPINLESTTMDRESIEKSIDSDNSMELLDKSDDVDVQTPIKKDNVKMEMSSTKEDDIQNKEEMVKDNANQLIVDENICDGKGIEESTKSNFEVDEVENHENKIEYLDDQGEIKEGSLNDQNNENKEIADENKEASTDETKETSADENKEASADENKEASADEKEEKKEASLDDQDKTKETSSDDQNENKEASSNEKANNLDNSNNEESKLSNDTIQLNLNDCIEKSDDKNT